MKILLWLLVAIPAVWIVKFVWSSYRFYRLRGYCRRVARAEGLIPGTPLYADRVDNLIQSAIAGRGVLPREAVDRYAEVFEETHGRPPTKHELDAWEATAWRGPGEM
jgi:hypothetical protein